MAQNNYPPSAEMDIRNLQERIKALEAAVQTRVALNTITGGTLTVQDAAGNAYVVIGKLGPNWPDGSPQYGLSIGRQIGSEQVGGAILALFTDAPGTAAQALSLYDASGNLVYNDDAVSAFGIARPYLSFPMERSDSTNWVTVTSPVMTDVYFGFPPLQQPKVSVWGYVYAPAGTTAQIQLISGTTVLGSPLSINPAGVVSGFTYGPVAMPPGVFADPIDLRLQAARTAGTGIVQVGVGASFGCQS